MFLHIYIFFRNFAPQIRAIGFADILLKAFALFEDSFNHPHFE